MFKNILVVHSEKLSQKHLEVVEQLRKIIKQDLKINCEKVCARDLNESYFQGKDLVIAAGGDGTLIRASHFIDDIPILGINSEPEFSEGALTSIYDTDINRLKEIIQGSYSVEKWQRIEIKLNNKVLKQKALNEVYVGSANQFHTSRYIIEFGGQSEEQRSSGVLITSGSGSSGWYNSAGGEKFAATENKLKFLVREPFFGRIFQPKILKGEILESEKIAFRSKRHSGGVLALDSNLTFPFNKGDNVEISMSNKPLNVIK